MVTGLNAPGRGDKKARDLIGVVPMDRKGTPLDMFGQATLEARNNGKASWSRTEAQTGRVAWAAKLDAGLQTSWDDYARVNVPVNEMPFTDLKSVRLFPNYGVAVGIDMAVSIFMHDPANFNNRIELSHTPYTNTATGWRELDAPFTPPGVNWFWYGSVTGTPSNATTEGSSYTWKQFQTDVIFKQWTIFRIAFDYGFYTGDVVMNNCYLAQALINGTTIRLEPSIQEQLALLYDRTADAIKTVPAWTFGEASLFAARNSSANWARGNPVQVYQKGSTQWVANLYGGIQTNDDWASVVVPVNELPVPELTAAEWTYFLTNAESAGVNIVVWVHDPDDFSKRAEITQLTGLTSKDAGYNRETLDSSATEMFYYGENVGSPDTTPTAGTNYTWAQFQGDSVFSRWTIYRITFDYGWIGASTLEDAWVTEISINGQQIPLKPDSGGSGRIATRYFEVESADLTGTISPKTPYRLLSMSVHVDAVPDTGELLTLTVDSNKNDHFDTLVWSDDLFIGSRTSVFAPFGEGYDFDADDDIDLFQTNGSDDDWGVTIRYQTVFP